MQTKHSLDDENCKKLIRVSFILMFNSLLVFLVQCNGNYLLIILFNKYEELLFGHHEYLKILMMISPPVMFSFDVIVGVDFILFFLLLVVLFFEVAACLSSILKFYFTFILCTLLDFTGALLVVELLFNCWGNREHLI